MAAWLTPLQKYILSDRQFNLPGIGKELHLQKKIDKSSFRVYSDNFSIKKSIIFILTRLTLTKFYKETTSVSDIFDYCI